MKKIIFSVAIIAAIGAIVIGATTAYFSDTETSTGNTFTAGAIDLKVDSQCSYSNGDVEPCVGTWGQAENGIDIVGEKFFTFSDLKPGDFGENTISLHVFNNDAYVCATINNMVDLDNDMTEPEGLVDTTPDGDLAGEVNFFAWADDGDNIWEDGELMLFTNKYGPASDVLNGKVYPLYTPQTVALVGDNTGYIGLYWCYGDLTVDESSHTLTCDGSAVTNISQTDSFSADISFYVEQARNNEGFVCPSLTQEPEMAQMNLDNKDASWQVIGDNTFGTITYSVDDSTFHGTVVAQGLEANGYYQITLNGPVEASGTCGFTNLSLGNFGSNTFESGFWNSAYPNLASTCTVNDEEGIYNMNLIGDHYTVQADASGNINYPFNLSLPTGSYTGVKVLVKKMLNTHVSPWVDTTTEHTTNLFETGSIDFIIN